MNFNWSIFIDLGLIAAALLLATLIRARVRFFQRYLIPNSLTAGFLLLPFYNYLAPRLGLGTGGLENLIYHLLNISFVSMSLRSAPRKTSGRSVFSMAVTVLSQYSLQCLLGFGLTFLFIATILPNLFPSFGLFLTLGFCLGPGQSFAIGSGWERYGFLGAGSVGLTFAAFGFLWACFGGIFLINLGLRRGWIAKDRLGNLNREEVRRGIYRPGANHPVGAEVTTEPEAIDPMSYNLAIVLAVYFLTFLFLKGITLLLSLAGPMGRDLAVNLWGISFIFAAMIALAFKKLLQMTGAAFTMDNGSLNRIAGTSVDVMVAASLSAISITVVMRYWIPIAAMVLVGGGVTLLTLLWLSSRIFQDHHFHRGILIYGAMTGTLVTGLALLRVIDQEFETPAASDYMYGAGLVFLLAIPLIISINFPAYGYSTGNPLYYWLSLAIYTSYLLFVLIAYRAQVGRSAFRRIRVIWRKS